MIKILQNPNFQGLFVLAVIIGLGVFLLMQNSQPEQRIARPQFVTPTDAGQPAWRVALETQIHLPTVTNTEAVPTSNFIPPTISIDSSATPMIFQVTQIRPNPLPSITPLENNLETATIEFLGSTPIPSPTGVDIAAFEEDAGQQFQPPPEQVPLSAHPFDHFFLARPVNASGNSRSIFYYPYGGRWPDSETRVHHGVDMPNDIGEQVQAAADGIVIWSGLVTEDGVTEDGMELYASYGNFVVIEHDFTYNGKKIWTLYAHLAARLVDVGTQVKMGDRVGLVGTTGVVTGAHVHFEIRVGENTYWATRNPLLWIAPYLDHGVIAGRVVDDEGIFIDEVRLQINRGGRLVDQTVTYAQPFGGRSNRHRVVPDDNRQENFVFGDVRVGTYQIVAIVQGRRFQQTVTVNPGTVNWIEFQVNPPESTVIPTPDDS